MELKFPKVGLVSVLNSTKKVSFCFAKRCKEDQLLAIGVQPNCHNFQISPEGACKGSLAAKEFT